MSDADTMSMQIVFRGRTLTADVKISKLDRTISTWKDGTVVLVDLCLSQLGIDWSKPPDGE